MSRHHLAPRPAEELAVVPEVEGLEPAGEGVEQVAVEAAEEVEQTKRPQHHPLLLLQGRALKNKSRLSN